jgi:hypothetical protein
VCAGSNPAEGAIPIASLPDDVTEVTEALHRGYAEILGDGLASFFLYGAAMFDRPEGWRIDYDFHVLLRAALDDTDRAAIRDLYAEVGNASELGRDLDGYCVLLADATGSEPPRHQLQPEMRDEAWALHRAHVLAGRYFLVTGIDPAEIVVPPTWAELDAALRSQFEFVEEHAHEPAYGILNSARILYSFAMRDVVVSKYHAAQWALESLPGEWHDGVRAALRFYRRQPDQGDDRVFEECRAPFIAYVKRSLPLG